MRIAAAGGAAQVAGVRAGQRLADARALVPGLDVAEWDRAGDKALLMKLAVWATRYTPWTRAEIPPPEAHLGAGLLLDISGCAHLFGGESALLDDLLKRVNRLGFEARAAVADTVGAAWAVARHGAERASIVRPGAIHAAVAPLPPVALRISPGMADDLARLGLVTIGDLLARPRAPLVARFGAILGTRLDALTGARPEPVAPEEARVPARARLLFGDPLVAIDDILAAITLAARDLAAELDRRQQGARRLRLVLYRVDAEVFRFAAGTSTPTREPERLARLFAEKLVPPGGMSGADIDIGYGIEGVVLEALAVDALDARQKGLDAGPEDGSALSELVDRLSNRLGAERVLTLKTQASHLPERAQAAVPVLEADGFAEGAVPFAVHGDAQLRPIRMLARPEPVEVLAEVPEGPPRQFRWRRVLHTVARADGPERLAPEWWLDTGSTAATRDYYRVEDDEGRRFWLYREGLYGRETDAPRWFVHGVFG